MADLFLERHVIHLPDKMFNLVNDLEDYPRFVPNCLDMEVRPEAGSDARLARMTIKFGPLTQSYTSRVVSDAEAKTITAKAVDGPFAYLNSKWEFGAEGMGTRIRFDINFKFSVPLVASVAEPAFAKKQSEILQAFADEADRRYGA